MTVTEEDVEASLAMIERDSGQVDGTRCTDVASAYRNMARHAGRRNAMVIAPASNVSTTTAWELALDRDPDVWVEPMQALSMLAYNACDWPTAWGYFEKLYEEDQLPQAFHRYYADVRRHHDSQVFAYRHLTMLHCLSSL